MPLAPGHTAIAGGGPARRPRGLEGRRAGSRNSKANLGARLSARREPGFGRGAARCGPLGRAVRPGGSAVVPGGRDARASPERGGAAPRRRSAAAQSNYRGSGAGSRLCPGPGGGAPGAAGAGHPAQPLPPSPLSSPRAWRRPAAPARLRGPLLFPAAGRPAIGVPRAVPGVCACVRAWRGIPFQLRDFGPLPKISASLSRAPPSMTGAETSPR